jgi:ABC-type phosphate/phosphonate transport system substrate-binding protein
MIAALDMYDFQQLRRHNDRLWRIIAAEMGKAGIAAPGELSRVDDVWALWRDPDLVFAQTCGYPLVSELRDDVTLIGTPDYGIISGRPGWYNSVIVVRKGDKRDSLAAFEGARLAYNDSFSQSGCHALMFAIRQEIGETRLFASCLETGGHAASVLAVIENYADIAAVDAVTWRFLRRFMPETDRLQVLMETLPSPGLPFIAAKELDGAVLATAVETAIAQLPLVDRKALGLVGFWHSTVEDYDLIWQRAERSDSVFKAHGMH